jgi:predicted dehydrogenase
MRLGEPTQTIPLPGNPRPLIVIGAGGIVRDAHLPAYSKVGFEVAGIYDVVEARAQEVATEFRIPRVFRSLAEAVEKAPARAVFDVAVPASAILEVLPALPDGSGVLIQKPMGENLAQARSIREFCHRKRLVAAVNFQLRYAPYVLAARDLIDQGAIGKVHDMEIRLTAYTPWHLWTFFTKLPRVEILYHSIHYLDLTRAFLGEPRGIYAKTLRHPRASNLASTRSAMIIDYDDVLRATVTTNHWHEFGQRHQESYIKWEGTSGAIVATMGLLLNYPRGVPDELEYCALDGGAAPHWQRIALQGSWFPDAFGGIMANLQRFLEGTCTELETNVDDAYKTMALVEGAYISSAQGGVPIPQ